MNLCEQLPSSVCVGAGAYVPRTPFPFRFLGGSRPGFSSRIPIQYNQNAFLVKPAKGVTLCSINTVYLNHR